MAVTPVHLLVFRDGRTRVSGDRLKAGLARRLQELSFHSSRDQMVAALLAAGELECAVADTEPITSGREIIGRITDSLAELLLGSDHFRKHDLLSALEQAPVPDLVCASSPEGFAYYALHPLSYADVLDRLSGLHDSVAVIGIRSIGTTLSAVAAAAARKRGKRAARITVRPQGHPYNREFEFAGTELVFLRERLERGADFLIVDEGPGLSGSSFLSVAEGLENAGVPRGCITLVCAHEPQLDHFRANDGPQRARRFRWMAAAGESRKPAEAEKFIGAGEWRRVKFSNEPDWPAAWTSFERLKYLSSGHHADQRLYKFAGFGRYGETVIEREKIVAAAGFGPEPRPECNGFYSYPCLSGRPMTRDDLSSATIQLLAEYCAFRARALSADASDIGRLQKMAEHNLAEFKLDGPVQLRVERPVIADGRMQPHEWILEADGSMLKTDSGSHGDDHFFPGPTDIAWDLAGAIVEWQMDEAQRECFLDLYRRAGGDDPQSRTHDYLIAYTAFRAGYCRMAANAMSGSYEAVRLSDAAERYQGILRSNAQLAIGA